MKKMLVVLLSLALIFGMVGCSGKVDDAEKQKKVEDFQNLVEWTNNYKIEHPGATDEEIDKAFNDGMAGLETWTNNYKKEHPGATDEEIDQAFKDAWEK